MIGPAVETIIKGGSKPFNSDKRFKYYYKNGSSFDKLMKKSKSVRDTLNISRVSPINLNETVRSIESDVSLVPSSTGAKLATNTTSSFKNIMPKEHTPFLLKRFVEFGHDEPEPIAEEEEVRLEESKGERPINEEVKKEPIEWKFGENEVWVAKSEAVRRPPINFDEPVQPSRLAWIVKGIPNVAKQAPGKTFDALIMAAVEVKAA